MNFDVRMTTSDVPEFFITIALRKVCRPEKKATGTSGSMSNLSVEVAVRNSEDCYNYVPVLPVLINPVFPVTRAFDARQM